MLCNHTSNERRFDRLNLTRLKVSFFTRLKVLLILALDWMPFLALDQKFNNALKSFDLVFKVVGTDFGTRSKVLIMVFLA